jgi:choloylglycine hydrolase
MRRATFVIVVACSIAAGACTPVEPAPEASFFVPAWTGSACSAISLTADGCLLFGANLDYRLHTRGQVFANPRGMHKTGLIAGTTGAYAEWISAYASLTFNFVGYHFPWSGMNERGLVMSTMAFPQTIPEPPDQRPVVDSGFWMQYILDTCATVDDLIASNALVRNITVDHYLVADRTGASAVIEYLDGELVVHTGDDLPVSVLSNWYYDDSLRLWQMYRGSGSYSWMDSSLQRFCIAADRVSSTEATTVEDGISSAFDTLEAIAGENFSEHASQWSMVFDTCALRVYFKTLAHPDLRFVDLDDVRAWCDQPVTMLEIQEPLSGDVAPWFTEYSHADARDHYLWFLTAWETGVTPAYVDQLLSHFESFTCDPPQRRRRSTGRRAAPDGGRVSAP